MKLCITEEQYNQLPDENVVEFTKYFKFAEGLESKWWTLGKNIEVLQGENIKVEIDNCIPASVWVIKENGKKEYTGMELCDVLWNVLLDCT